MPTTAKQRPPNSVPVATNVGEGSLPLPAGWEFATIPDLAGNDGVFCDGDWVESKDQDVNGDVRLVQLADVGDGSYRDKSSRFLTSTKAAALRCTYIKPNDVLIARMPDPLGRACIFPGDAKPSVTVVDVCIVRSGKREFDHRWLSWFVNASPFRSAVAGLQAGSTRKRISRKNLGTIQLPVPPLPEQRRIVAEIEKQFTRLDAGVAALQRVQANLQRYRAAVLKAACEGRLVENEVQKAKKEGRSIETGEQLLQRILKQRREKWSGKGKYKKPVALETINLPELPEGWCWASFPQLDDGSRHALKAGPFGSSLKKSVYTPKGYKIYGQEQVIRGNPCSGEYYIDKVLFEKLRSCEVHPGDILVSLVGTTGRILILPNDIEPGIINPRLVKLSLNRTAVNVKYVKMFFESSKVRSLFKFAAHGGTMEVINLGILKSMPLPLPPLAEQERIVAEVERRLSVVEELSALVTANLQRATRLRQSILQRAFIGQLVRQEQTDAVVNVSMPKSVQRKLPNRHFIRAVLSAEIVHQLHAETTFGRIKHQKIFHLCEHIAKLEDIQGEYHREAAGPLDNRLIYANEAELNKQNWYQVISREQYGHAYEPMAKAGGHRKYLERYWPDKLPLIENLIKLMRTWDTDHCEIFSTAYAAWNDLMLWDKEPTENAILDEILNRWHEQKRRFPEDRWRKAIAWIRQEGFVPTGFGIPTRKRACNSTTTT